MTAYFDGPRPRAFAHRGWHTGDLAGLENTMVAFRRAVDEGFTYLETDAHTTSDGVLVAFHDSHLDRVTNSHGRVSELTWDEVRQARIGGREKIPLLEEIITAFPNTRLNIDPKADAAVGPLIDLLTRSGAAERVCVASFSDTRLAGVAAAMGPDLVISLGPRGIARLAGSALLRRSFDARGARAAQVPVRLRRLHLVTAPFLTTAHSAGLEVHVWTVDDRQEMGRLLDLGVDAIMTDRPDRLRDVLVERGQWVR